METLKALIELFREHKEVADMAHRASRSREAYEYANGWGDALDLLQRLAGGSLAAEEAESAICAVCSVVLDDRHYYADAGRVCEKCYRAIRFYEDLAAIQSYADKHGIKVNC